MYREVEVDLDLLDLQVQRVLQDMAQVSPVRQVLLEIRALLDRLGPLVPPEPQDQQALLDHRVLAEIQASLDRLDLRAPQVPRDLLERPAPQAPWALPVLRALLDSLAQQEPQVLREPQVPQDLPD